MSTTWTRIPREEASSYPFYGVGGWLALFVTLLIVETGAGFYEMFTALRYQEIPLRAFLMDGDSWAVFPKLVLGVLLITTLMILAVLFSRAPVFRPMALTALVARGPLFAAAYLYTIRGADGWISLTALLGVWLIECVIWVTYLQRSRRVRLTYESTVKTASNASWSALDSDNLRYVGDGIATPLKRAKTDEPVGAASRTSAGAPGAEPASGGRAEPSVFSSDPDAIDLPDDLPPLPPSLRRKQLMAEAAAAPLAAMPSSNGVSSTVSSVPPVASSALPVASPALPAPLPIASSVTSSGTASVGPSAAASIAPSNTATSMTSAPTSPPQSSSPPSLVPMQTLPSTSPFTGAPVFAGGASPSPASATAARIAAAGSQNVSSNGSAANPAAPPFPTLPDNAWEAALDEFEGPQRRRGLWARVFAQARGDEKRAQADYLLIRARELSLDRDFVESSSRPLI